MIRKTKIEKKLRRKTNPHLVKTIIAAKKNKAWLEVAHIISTPKRKQISVNLNKIDKQTSERDTVVIPGKVLSEGEVSKKVRIVALSFSDKAKEKLKKTKSECVNLLEEIKKNPNAKGIKVIK